MLVSQNKAVTFFHIDHTGTSVFYVVLRGTKIFYVVPPSPTNRELWNDWLEDETPNTFFGSTEGLDPPCEKVVVTAGEAIVMGPRTIHCVETVGFAIALAANFVHTKLVHQATKEYVREQYDDAVNPRYSYNGFVNQVITHILNQPRFVLVSIGKINFLVY